MTYLTATEARGDFFSLIKDAARKHEIFHIRHAAGNAVLLSEEEYESLLETAQLLSSTEFNKSFKRSKKQWENNKTIPFEEVL